MNIFWSIHFNFRHSNLTTTLDCLFYLDYLPSCLYHFTTVDQNDGELHQTVAIGTYDSKVYLISILTQHVSGLLQIIGKYNCNIIIILIHQMYTHYFIISLFTKSRLLWHTPLTCYYQNLWAITSSYWWQIREFDCNRSLVCIWPTISKSGPYYRQRLDSIIRHWSCGIICQ